MQRFVWVPPRFARRASHLERAGRNANPTRRRRDRGLAGGFNANVFRAIQRFTVERQAATPPVKELTLEDGADKLLVEVWTATKRK